MSTPNRLIGLALALCLAVSPALADGISNSSAGSPSGTAGGDLSGTFPNPTVAKVAGVTPGTGVATALGVNVGSAGAFVTFNGAFGTPSSGVLTNATGLPISTGLTGAGTGVLTALGINVGSAGAPVLFNGAGGTPSSITLTNGTGMPVAGVVGAAASANYPSSAVSGFLVISKQVDFSVGNTDTTITSAIPLPTGFTRYYVQSVKLNGASASINGATASVWCGAGGTGTNIVANATAVTLAVTAESTAANSQQLTAAVNGNTETIACTTIFFRVQATAAGTAWVTFTYQPAS